MKPPLPALLLPGIALGLWCALVAALVWATLSVAEQEAIGGILASRAALVLLAWVIASAALAWLAQWLVERHIVPLQRLAEDAGVLLGAPVGAPLATEGNAPARALAAVVNALAAERTQLRDSMRDQVRDAAQRIEQERRRLATLMAELSHSVVVCNLDGRILLYNQRARLQFKALAAASDQAHGAGVIGLGRSIYSVFDRRLIDHALDNIRSRLARGASNPAAQFVTATPSGQLLRVQLAAVLDSAKPGDDAKGTARIGGFVLMLDNVTREFEQESLRDRLLHAMTEGNRGSLANLQAAVEMLRYDDMDNSLRARFLGVIQEETATMAERVRALAQTSAAGLTTRWPMQDMLGTDLMSAIMRRTQADEGPALEICEPPEAIWLRVDSFSLIQAFAYLARRLSEELGVRHGQLRLSRSEGHAHLDLLWIGQAMSPAGPLPSDSHRSPQGEGSLISPAGPLPRDSHRSPQGEGSLISTETAMGWELDPIRVAGGATPLTVRDIVERHGGAFWVERERARHAMFFRFLLPLAGALEAAQPEDATAGEERPEFYDFDLFQVSEHTRALDEQRLDALIYTVFDTETTGLDPSGGDEIIQIGATRIVNGRLLQQEGFEQLVDPGRPVSAAAIQVHGITPDRLAGQPPITQVLPAFHRYAQDTVLVAHNAAFDMRFLQLKESLTGLRFDQPVLDTLLLSALVHPHQESHALEALARRLHIDVTARHTALGDATVTAQVFLKLIPLLAQQGVFTLGQARAESQKTWFARVQY